MSCQCSAKAMMHEAVCVLAAAKLNSVQSYISKVLEDGNISDKEYQLIMSEVENYLTMKNEI